MAVPDTTTYPGSDYYEIAVVQYRMKFHRDLPATLLRGYVQLSTSVVPGTHGASEQCEPRSERVPATPNRSDYYGVDNPHYLGPTIVATKDRPVRILFRNLLPTGVERRPVPAGRHLVDGLWPWPEHDAARRERRADGYGHG